jgi:tetratricopeptide (TPR) repeat protein
LTSLVNNSLLRQDEVNGEPRFSMLETIRAYALERLAESGEMPALQQGHAQYYWDIVLNQAGYGIYSANTLYWLNWLERELDNIRATLSWCVASSKGVELGAGLIWLLMWFWYRHGYFSEGRMWTDRVLHSPYLQEYSRSKAMVLASSGFLAMWQGEQETALAQLQKSLAIVQKQEDEQMMPLLFLGNGVILINMGHDSEAQPLLKEAQILFKQQNQSYFHVFTLVHLGNVELGMGNPEQARALHKQAETEARTIGENWLLSFALNNLGEVARTEGQYELARTYYEECEVLLRDTGDKGDVARFVHSLGYIAQHEGDYGRAESQFRKSLAMFRRLGNRRGMAECMAGLAGLKARQGDNERGATMLCAAEYVLKSTGGAWWPADRREVEANQELIRSVLSEAELKAAQKKGNAMTLEQALAFASE